MFAACATAEPLLDVQSNRRFFISSVIIHVPEAQKRDGVTVADGQLLSMAHESCPHAHFDAVVKPDFVKVGALAEVFEFTFQQGHRGVVTKVPSMLSRLLRACLTMTCSPGRVSITHSKSTKKRSEKSRDSKPIFGKHDCNTQRPHTNINMATSGQERET